jgi:5-methylcytosine-specific restriction endonuclease McrA
MAKASADYRRTPRGKASAVAISLRYQKTDRGKEMVENWKNSDIGKASAKKRDHKFRQSKKGIAARKKRVKTEKYKAMMRRYMLSDKGRAKIARDRHKRRSKTRSLLATLTAEEWNSIKGRYKNRCVYCGEKKSLTMDHIIPLSKGGTHTKDNVVPACVSCNSIKGNRPVLLQLLVI